jgi:hypothetical protein
MRQAIKQQQKAGFTNRSFHNARVSDNWEQAHSGPISHSGDLGHGVVMNPPPPVMGLDVPMGSNVFAGYTSKRVLPKSDISKAPNHVTIKHHPHIPETLACQALSKLENLYGFGQLVLTLRTNDKENTKEHPGFNAVYLTSQEQFNRIQEDAHAWAVQTIKNGLQPPMTDKQRNEQRQKFTSTFMPQSLVPAAPLDCLKSPTLPWIVYPDEFFKRYVMCGIYLTPMGTQSEKAIRIDPLTETFIEHESSQAATKQSTVVMEGMVKDVVDYVGQEAGALVNYGAILGRKGHNLTANSDLTSYCFGTPLCLTPWSSMTCKEPYFFTNPADVLKARPFVDSMVEKSEEELSSTAAPEKDERAEQTNFRQHLNLNQRLMRMQSHHKNAIPFDEVRPSIDTKTFLESRVNTDDPDKKVYHVRYADSAQYEVHYYHDLRVGKTVGTLITTVVPFVRIGVLGYLSRLGVPTNDEIDRASKDPTLALRNAMKLVSSVEVHVRS